MDRRWAIRQSRCRYVLLAGAAIIASCSKTPNDPEGTTYSDLVRADAPVAYWRFEESTGPTAQDSSGKAHTAQFVENPTLASSVGSRTGRAAAFNGGPDGVVNEDPNWTRFTNLTVEAWIRPDSVTSPDGLLVLDKGNAWGLQVGSDGRPMFGFPYDQGQATASAAVERNKTYHLVGTYSAGVLRIYVNGALAGEDPAAAPTIPPTEFPVHVGRGLSLDRFQYAGIIDEVAIYDHVLSPAEIRKHYEAGR